MIMSLPLITGLIRGSCGISNLQAFEPSPAEFFKDLYIERESSMKFLKGTSYHKT